MKVEVINRRTALRRLLYIAGGTLLLPACYRQSGKETIALTHLVIDEEQENLMAELVETIIPASDTPGGKELLLHLFVFKMVDDCHKPEDQADFAAGLASFAACSREKMGQDFRQLTTDQRIVFLESIEEMANEQVKRFYAITKRRTIQGYTNSKYVMTDLKKYELVPGRYNGYFKMG
ncbi:gluconate 2-dehydrogenase subunit 3 family protein [Sphingobacterium corticibacterium]|uniref:gluconate 2-dehydrogenase subunit 3 family protein n=1 Tax=Sphingobacterium corticibacterium TaxID=2484746 RepID=UPI001EF10007|nr:gluconate 2-dehydrogenase subunit 3 family protein [Sphingobacterium corticibacterium]